MNNCMVGNNSLQSERRWRFYRNNGSKKKQRYDGKNTVKVTPLFFNNKRQKWSQKM